MISSFFLLQSVPMDAIIARLETIVDDLKERHRLLSENFERHCVNNASEHEAFATKEEASKLVEEKLEKAAEALSEAEEADKEEEAAEAEVEEATPDAAPEVIVPADTTEREPERTHVLHKRVG